MPSPRPFSTLALLLSFSLLATVGMGCGYRFLARSARLPGGARTLMVPMVVNHSGEPGLEGALTGAWIEAVERTGALRVVSSGGETVLRVTVLSAEGKSRAVSSGVTTALRATLEQEAILQAAGTDQVLWRSGPVRKDADYSPPPLLAGEDFLTTEDLRRRALVRAGARGAEDIVQRLLGGS